MRCYVIQPGFGYENLQPIDRPIPVPGPGEVLVAIKAVSLNYRDLLVLRGQYNPKMSLPRIPCSDGAGEVVQVGPGVTRVKVGDRVAGIFMQSWLAGAVTEAAARSALGGELDGMLSEYVVLNAEGVVPLPSKLSYEAASTLPCAAVTAWHALRAGGIKAGDSFLIQGTGGVSMFSLQLGRALGARVLAISGSEAKIDRLHRDFGLVDVASYKSKPDWEKWVREQTGGQGVDQVIEVGGAGTLERSIRAVRMGGHIALIGVLTGGTGTVNPLPALMRSICIQGIFVGSRTHFEELLKVVTLHGIDPVIDRVFPFADAVGALRHLESGRHFGKIVIRVAA